MGLPVLRDRPRQVKRSYTYFAKPNTKATATSPIEYFQEAENKSKEVENPSHLIL